MNRPTQKPVGNSEWGLASKKWLMKDVGTVLQCLCLCTYMCVCVYLCISIGIHPPYSRGKKTTHMHWAVRGQVKFQRRSPKKIFGTISLGSILRPSQQGPEHPSCTQVRWCSSGHGLSQTTSCHSCSVMLISVWFCGRCGSVWRL